MHIIYGCSSNTEEDEGINENADTSGGELHFATNAQPATLDPHMSEATIVRDIARHVFEPLLTVNSNYEVEPMLVESYEESEDGKQITFNLRQGIKFHNGEEMTSEDVVASMERWYERSNTAQTALEGSSFEAIDDYTVVLHVENPSVFVLPSLAGTIQFAGIMPKEIIENASETGVEEYIGTGPFQFKEWRQDQYILLEKFADYQALDEPADGLAGKKEALVDDLYIHIVNDPSTRLTGLMTDEYDIGFAYEVDMLDQLESADDVEIISPMVGYSVVIYNKNEGLFKDLKMRQAVNTALSMEEIGQASFLDRYRINPSIAPEEQVDWYSEQGEEHYNLADIEKAKSLLEDELPPVK